MSAIDASLPPLLPVSTAFDPPFDILTAPPGTGERQSGADVGAALLTHGTWQPSVQPGRRPGLAEVVVGALGRGGAAGAAALVDVGAGHGLVSLAAAARGHRVHAFELGPRSLEVLESSIKHNGVEHLVQVHHVPLGSPGQRQQRVCVRPAAHAAAAAAAQAGTRQQKQQQQEEEEGAPQGRASGGGANATSAGHGAVEGGGASADVDVLRGYAGLEAAAAAAAGGCSGWARRVVGAAIVPLTEAVGALKISGACIIFFF